MSGERAFMDIGDFYGGPMNMVTPLLREYPISVVYYLFSLQSVVYELVFWIIYMYDVHCTYFFKIPFLYFLCPLIFIRHFVSLLKSCIISKKSCPFQSSCRYLLLFFPRQFSFD